MAKTIGIDLGTTNSCVAVMEGWQSQSCSRTAEGGRTTPSVVAFTDSGDRLVGTVAKRQAVMNPERTIFSIKRFMGRKKAEVTEEETIVPYKVDEGPNGDVRIEVDGKQYSPPEISAMILQKLKADAEAKLGDTVDSAVITVPAYFNDDQRQATKDAGKVAGLEVKRIINEPTAAALAYGLDKEGATRRSSSSTSAAARSTSRCSRSVTASSRSRRPPGTTISAATTGTRRSSNGWSPSSRRTRASTSPRTRTASSASTKQPRRRRSSSRPRRRRRSTCRSSPRPTRGPKHLDIKLTRSKLNELTADLLERSRRARSNRRSPTPATRLEHVVLVGGMTRMPTVQEKVKELVGKDPHQGVNPDEVVAIGAAIQAGVLAGDVKDVLLLDVTPLSLGIETKGGVMTKLIERNTTIPTKKSEIFSTAEDNQPSVEVHVLQGEREMAAHNKSLGKFQLTGIPPAQRGTPQIEVTFDIDANGILHVSAKDLGTGKEQKIEIKGGSGLDESEVEQMIKDAEEHADEDRAARELAEARNLAENAAHQAEKQLEELGDQVDEAAKSQIEAAIKDVREVSESDDVAEIKSKTDALQSAFQNVSEQIYQAAQNLARASDRRRHHRELQRRGRRRRGDRRRRGGRRREVVGALWPKKPEGPPRPNPRPAPPEAKPRKCRLTGRRRAARRGRRGRRSCTPRFG